MPADTEIVLEGVIRCDETVREGPFGEFVGYLAPGRSDADRRGHRASPTGGKPIYHAINGYGRETVMLRKYVLEASLLKVLGSRGADRDRRRDDGGRAAPLPRHRPGEEDLAGPRRAAAQRHPGVRSAR